jgi:hypothetical protein
MLYAIVDLLITVIIVGLMLVILGAIFSISCFATFVKGFFKNIRLVDSVFLFFVLFLSLAFVLNIHIAISGVAALVVAFAVYKIMDTNIGYLIFSILFSPAWAFTFSFIIYLFNRNKLRSGIIFAALLIIAAYAHYSQRDDMFYLDFHLPTRSKKPKLKKEHVKKVKSPKVCPKTAAEPDNNIIIGRSDTNEAVIVEVVDEEEYETHRFNE